MPNYQLSTINYQLLTLGYVTLDRILTLENTEAKVICSVNPENRLFCLNYGDKIPVSDYHETLGGNSANAAVTGARLGIKTATWTVMGDDAIGHQAHAMFKKEGVGLDYFFVDKRIKSSIHTILSYKAERTILSYGREGSYHLPSFRPVEWVYLTSLLPGGEVIFKKVVELAKRDNAKLVYQPGHLQLRIPPNETADLLQATYLIVMNKEEAQAFTRINTDTSLGLKKAIQKLHSYGPKIVVVTDGAKGGYASDGTTLYFQPIEKTPVIERTGAGDAYASALVVALINKKSLMEAMNWGLLNAQGVIAKIGPQAGILHKSELEKLFASGHPKITIHKEALV